MSTSHTVGPTTRGRGSASPGVQSEADSDAPSAVRATGNASNLISDTRSKRVMESPTHTTALISNLIPMESPNDRSVSVSAIESPSSGASISQAAATTANMIVSAASTSSLAGGSHNAYISVSRCHNLSHSPSSSQRQTASAMSQRVTTRHGQKKKTYLFSSTSPSQPSVDPNRGAGHGPISSSSTLVPDSLSSSLVGSHDLIARPTWANVMTTGSNTASNHNTANTATFYRGAVPHDSNPEVGSFSTTSLARGGSGPSAVAGVPRSMWSSSTTAASLMHGRTLSGSDGAVPMGSVSATTAATSLIGTSESGPLLGGYSVGSSLPIARTAQAWAMPSGTAHASSPPLLSRLHQAEPPAKLLSYGGSEVAAMAEASAVRRPDSANRHRPATVANFFVPPSAVVPCEAASAPADYLIPAAQRGGAHSAGSSAPPGPQSSQSSLLHTSAESSSHSTRAPTLNHSSSQHTGTTTTVTPAPTVTFDRNSGSETITGSHSTMTGGRDTGPNSMSTSPHLAHFLSSPGSANGTGTGTGVSRHSSKAFLFPKPQELAVLPSTMSAMTYLAQSPHYGGAAPPRASSDYVSITSGGSATASQGSFGVAGSAPSPSRALVSTDGFSAALAGSTAASSQSESQFQKGQSWRDVSFASHPTLAVSVSPYPSSRDASPAAQPVTSGVEGLLTAAPAAKPSGLRAYLHTHNHSSTSASATTTATTTTTTSATPSYGRRSPAIRTDSGVSPYPPNTSPTSATTTTTATSTTTPSATAVSCFSGALAESTSEAVTSPSSAPSSTTSPWALTSTVEREEAGREMSPAELFVKHVAQNNEARAAELAQEPEPIGSPLSPTSVITAAPGAAVADDDSDDDSDDAEEISGMIGSARDHHDAPFNDSPLLLSSEGVDAYARQEPQASVRTAQPSPMFLHVPDAMNRGMVRQASEVSERSTFTTTYTQTAPVLYPPPLARTTSTTSEAGVLTNGSEDTVAPSPTNSCGTTPLLQSHSDTLMDAETAATVAADDNIAAFFQRRRKHRPPPLFGPTTSSTLASATLKVGSQPAAPAETAASAQTAVAAQQTMGSDNAGPTTRAERERADNGVHTPLAQTEGAARRDSRQAHAQDSCKDTAPLSRDESMAPALQGPRHFDPTNTAATATRMIPTEAVVNAEGRSCTDSLPSLGRPPVAADGSGGVSGGVTSPLTSTTSSLYLASLSLPNNAPSAVAVGTMAGTTPDSQGTRVRRRKAAPPNLFAVSTNATAAATNAVGSIDARPLPQQAHYQPHSSASSSTSTHPRMGEPGAFASPGLRTNSLGTSLNASAWNTQVTRARKGNAHRSGPLVRVSHDSRTLVAGPFRVSGEGCLTVRNVLLLNPTRIDAMGAQMGSVTPEMMALQSTFSNPAYQSGSQMASPVAALPASAMGSQLAGPGQSHMMPTMTSGSLLSPCASTTQTGASAFQQTQTSANAQLPSQSVRTRLLKPVNGLLFSSSASGATSPMATPELTGLAPPAHAGNASFTLQSTSYETPYSPITYSMDGCRFPGTATHNTLNSLHAATAGSSTSATAALLSGSFLHPHGTATGAHSPSSNNASSNVIAAAYGSGGSETNIGIPPRSHSRLSGFSGSLGGFARGGAGAEEAVGTVPSPRVWNGRVPPPASVMAGSPMPSATQIHNSNNSSFAKPHQPKFASYGSSSVGAVASPTSTAGGSQSRRRGPAGLAPAGGSPTNANTPSRTVQGQWQNQHLLRSGSAGGPGGLTANSHGSATAMTRASPNASSQAGGYYTGGGYSGVTSPHNGALDDAASSLLLPYSVVQSKLLQAAGSPQTTSALTVKAVRYSDLELCMRIGEGASAEVYVAIHRPTGRRLAVKRIDLSPLCLNFDGSAISPTVPTASGTPTPCGVTAGRGGGGMANNNALQALPHQRSRRRLMPLSARAKQLEHIVTRELLVLHLTYRSPFVVKVYNAFYLKADAALDVVMEFMHYGSLDHLMAQLEKHAKTLHRRQQEGLPLKQSPISSSEDARSSRTPLAADRTSPSSMGTGSESGALLASQRVSAEGGGGGGDTMNTLTPAMTDGHFLVPDGTNVMTPLSADASAHSQVYDSLLYNADTDEGIEEEEKGVAERVVAVVGEQLLRGLRDMHERGYIHRDIKPGNVLVNEHGVVKLSDFGLSQRCDASGVGIENPLFKTTQAFTRMPTPLTASPVTQGSGFSLSNSGGGGTPQFGNSPAFRPQPSPLWTTTSVSRPHVMARGTTPPAALCTGPNASAGQPPPLPPPSGNVSTSSAPPAPPSAAAAAAPHQSHTQSCGQAQPTASSWSASTAPLVQDHFSPHQHSSTTRLFHPVSASASAATMARGAASLESGGAGQTAFPYTPAGANVVTDSRTSPAPVDTTLPPATPMISEEAYSPLAGSPRARPPALQAMLTAVSEPGSPGVNGPDSGVRSPDYAASPSNQPLIYLAEFTTPCVNAEGIDERDSPLEYGADIKRAASTSSSSAASSEDEAQPSPDSSDDDAALHCSGTDKYMSPERQRGERHGKPSDVWAVGVTLAEFALGFYPYDLDGVTDEFERMQRMEKPVMFSALAQRRRVPLSPLFEDFIALATLPSPMERPTAQELLEHPFFRQWTTHPFNLKRYLAARVPVPSNAVKEEYLRRQKEETSVPNLCCATTGKSGSGN